MVEWGLIATFGIPACSILAFMAGRVWESLGNEQTEGSESVGQ